MVSDLRQPTGGGVHELGRSSRLRQVAFAAIGAPMLVLVIVGLLMVAISILQNLYYGPR